MTSSADVAPDATPRVRVRWGRKFVFVLLVFGVATGLLLGAKIDGATWANVALWCLGLYNLGNVGATAADALKGRLP